MIEIITEVVKGKTNVEVGKALFICEKTVKFHLTEIYKRIKLKSRAQLMAVVNEILRAEKEEQSLALPRQR
ncbi:MAG: LuxR family transcriptional regulator [Spirochaetes bacterium]|nr:MAG: LuxR family transcriptional regulator [Spirochaetota bacterium]